MEALHQPGDIIAQRYRIIDTLGQGGVGITYATEEVKSGQQVALKVLSLRQMGDWKVLELFEREAKVLAQLNHPAIPRYLDYFQVDTAEDRAFYIVQQLAEGKSLADSVKNGWRMNESGVRRIATQILEILVYLHDLKPPVIHRDIKPQNLIAGQNTKIFLVDFGAVQDTYRSTFAKGSTIIGTYGYMAPEQFLGKAVPATDLYGLGATVLFLLTHRSPADLPTERLKISFRSRIQISEGFADWLEKMLEADAEDRFPSAEEALEGLQGRIVIAKSRPSVPWKAVVGICVAAVAAVTVLNCFKWSILLALRFQPFGLCNAASSGNIDVVRDYLNQGGDPNAKDDNTSILVCSLNENRSNRDIVELLIAKGADVNARDNQGLTPLDFAAFGYRKDLVDLLIAKGADVSVSKDQSQRLLTAKTFSDGSVQADVSVSKDQRQRLLSSSIRHGWKDLAELMIAKGADVNASTHQGESLLFQALAGSKKDIVKLLIAKGADVNARTNYGADPLSVVVGYGWKDVAELMIAKGANVNNRGGYGGVTPLNSAARNGRTDLVKLLIVKGADVNVRDKSGKTPMSIAAAGGHWDAVELLESYGGIR
jgi:serine/threonine protein kinase